MATKKNSPYYAADMVTFPTPATSGHETSAKTLLNGVVVPAGQTPQQDLDSAVQNVFMHPNTPVYISRQLIQRLVTSNPSPGYVYRVAQVFADNGSGVRGDTTNRLAAIVNDLCCVGALSDEVSLGHVLELAAI